MPYSQCRDCHLNAMIFFAILVMSCICMAQRIPARSVQETYTVKYAESFHMIARKLGVSTDILARANNMQIHRVFIGQKLIVPSKDTYLYEPKPHMIKGTTFDQHVTIDGVPQVGTYTVQPNDELHLIARAYGVDQGELARANNMMYYGIFVGQVLLIPNSATGEKPPVSPSSLSSENWVILNDGKQILKSTINTEREPSLQRENSSDSGVGQRWAVVIGISDYADSRIPSLRYGERDAKEFCNWLVSPKGGRYAFSRVRLLLGKDATGTEIKSALFEWLKKTIEEDMVIIYFAGHGSSDSPDSPENLFLLPYDTDYAAIGSTGFPMWDIETALKRYIKAKKVVVITDACHSGGVGQSFDISRRSNRGMKKNPISTGFHSLSKVGDGVCVISATDDKQMSQEGKQWGEGHGVFTYFLLKGLRGKADTSQDGTVSLGELTLYLSQEVRRATENAQSPTVAGKFDPAMTIGR